MIIKSLPSEQRPREKLLHRGPKALVDAELIAIILRTGIAGKNAIELGQELLNHCGGVHKLLEASNKKLSEIKGIGSTKRAQIQAVLELAKRALASKLQTSVLMNSLKQVKNFLRLLLSEKERETFLCLFLDAKNMLISNEELFQGSIAETHVYPREIARKAIYYNAASIIVAHNHPSGLPIPSVEDKYLTSILRKSMDLIDVRLLDHLIIAGNKVFSFAEEGIL